MGTTTTHGTCSSFTCPPAPWTKVPGNPTCVATGCTKELCCVCLTTTPCTTTTHLTCSSFTCPPAPWTKVPGDWMHKGNLLRVPYHDTMHDHDPDLYDLPVP